MYKFQTKTTFSNNEKIIIPIENRFGKDLKRTCKNLLKKTPFYNTQIDLEEETFGEICKNKFQVKTIGDWCFGLPGYKGNLIFMPDKKYITIRATDLDQKAADALADLMGVTRSEVIRILIRRELDKTGLGPIIYLKEFSEIVNIEHEV